MAVDIQNGAVTISGLDAFEKKLKGLETTNPGFEKRLRGVIRKVLGEVRAKMRESAQTDLGMKSDPRKAYKAVRYAVYKRVLGGQVNILNSKNTVKGNYEPPRKGLPVRVHPLAGLPLRTTTRKTPSRSLRTATTLGTITRAEVVETTENWRVNS